ncbi:hypothetical protein F5Y18DRAFT_435156 [Xylariaceae sp. FL1019]|nr:hypothetical protein F5Y18DRAFT_435156 [Xylariaceae sp. FL1019]
MDIFTFLVVIITIVIDFIKYLLDYFLDLRPLLAGQTTTPAPTINPATPRPAMTDDGNVAAGVAGKGLKVAAVREWGMFMNSVQRANTSSEVTASVTMLFSAAMEVDLYKHSDHFSEASFPFFSFFGDPATFHTAHYHQPSSALIQYIQPRHNHFALALARRMNTRQTRSQTQAAAGSASAHIVVVASSSRAKDKPPEPPNPQVGWREPPHANDSTPRDGRRHPCPDCGLMVQRLVLHPRMVHIGTICRWSAEAGGAACEYVAASEEEMAAHMKEAHFPTRVGRKWAVNWPGCAHTRDKTSAERSALMAQYKAFWEFSEERE